MQSLPKGYEETFLRNLRYTDAHYEVGLPWIRDAHDLPCHLNMCFNRVKALQFRLMKDSKVLREYDLIIKDQLKKGIVERVLDAKLQTIPVLGRITCLICQ